MVNPEGYVRNTAGAEIPDTSRWGEWVRRLRADSAILGLKPNWLIAVGSAVVAGISLVGYRFWKRRQQS